MNVLEWNPAFGPIGSSLLLLGVSFGLFVVFHGVSRVQGRGNAWKLLWPKFVVAALLFLALFDPLWKSVQSNATPARIVVLNDISSSMDLKDDGSTKRNDRANQIIHDLESFVPANVHVQTLPFDTTIHEAGYHPVDGATRGTDLAGAMAAITNRADLAGADAVVVLTDGGDETVDLAKLPSTPLAIVGVGAPSDSWNDLGLGAVNAPASIEEGGEFDLEAEIYARGGSLKRYREALAATKVFLEEEKGPQWVPLQDKTVDLQSLHSAVSFHVKAEGLGMHRYRLRLPSLPEEVTLANNTRNISVQILRRAIHVLYFTQELGSDYKYLRAELASDPGVVFTAMYRVLQDRFTVQGDQTGFQDLEQGLPVDEKILQRYDCVILGSFAGSSFSEAQMKCLLHYVQNGGALVWLGGESSFGRGGYAGSTLAPLFPWSIANNEPELLSGTFPVSMNSASAAVGFANGLREALASAGSPTFDSLNQPGELRPGALGLLNATSGGQSQVVVATQHVGKGQVLGIATNTLWHWAAAGNGLKSLYGKFWRQALRGLTQKMEGGSLLGLHWDQDHYRPGESAILEIRLQGVVEGGSVRLVGSLSGPDGNMEINAVPVAGEAGFYQAKFVFGQRGEYAFHLAAYAGAESVENYERTLVVEPSIEEGANPELKEAYLSDLAKRAKGVYASERDLTEVKKYLKLRVFSQPSLITFPLVEWWNIFPILVIFFLVLEWFLRRRFNII